MKETTSFGVEDLCAPTTSLKPLSGTSTFAFSARDFVKQRTGVLSDVYEMGEKLGSGGYGEVFSCVHKQTKIERAVKILNRKHCAEADEDEDGVIKEFNILKELDHPNILRQIEMFSDEENYYIVTEVCRGGELFDEIQEWGNFIEEDAAELVRRLLSCVNYCHQKGICHRDLKPENMLLEEGKDLSEIKVIDFGLAQMVEKDTIMTDLAGSIYYIAPEVIQGSYTYKADIWSCGVIAFILLCGYAPFDGDTDEEIKEEILSGEFDFDDEIWDDVSEQAKDFILTLLELDPKERVTAEEAVKHPWMVQTRLDSSERLRRRSSVNERAILALYNLERFNVQNKLKQATCAFIASQLVLKDEKKKIDELFRALDVTNDGKLTKDNVRTGYKEVFGKELSQEMVDQMFNRIDVRNLGYIEYSEFVVASMNEKDLLNNDKLKHAFNMFDSDGSGVISKDELVEVMSYFQSVDNSLDGEAITRIIKEVDEDNTGEIDFEKFTAMMLKTADDALTEEAFISHLDASQTIAEDAPAWGEEDIPAPVTSTRRPLGNSLPATSAPLATARGPPPSLSFSLPPGSGHSAKRHSTGKKACLGLFDRTIEVIQEEDMDQLPPAVVARISVKRMSYCRIKRHDSEEVVVIPNYSAHSRRSSDGLRSSTASQQSGFRSSTASQQSGLRSSDASQQGYLHDGLHIGDNGSNHSSVDSGGSANARGKRQSHLRRTSHQTLGLRGSVNARARAAVIDELASGGPLSLDS